MGLRFVDPPNGPPPAASYRHLAVVPSGSRLLVLAGQIGNLSEAPLLRGWRLNMNKLSSTSTPSLPLRGAPPRMWPESPFSWWRGRRDHSPLKSTKSISRWITYQELDLRCRIIQARR